MSLAPPSLRRTVVFKTLHGENVLPAYQTRVPGYFDVRYFKAPRSANDSFGDSCTKETLIMSCVSYFTDGILEANSVTQRR